MQIQKHRSDKGFSLIEVIIAIDIMTFAALAFATFMSDQQKGLRFLTAKFEIESMNNVIREILKDQDNCTATVRSGYAVAPGTALTPPLTVPQVARVVSGTNVTQYQTATTYANIVQIESIILRPFQAGDPTPGSKFVITYEIQGGVSGPSKIVRLFDAFVDAVPAPGHPGYAFRCATEPFTGGGTALQMVSLAIPCSPGGGVLGTGSVSCPAGTVVRSCGFQDSSASNDEDVFSCTLDPAANSCLGYRDESSGCDGGMQMHCFCEPI